VSEIELPPGIALNDPRPIAASARYTYEMPFAEEIEALEPEDGVKAIFRETAGGREFDAERMWVTIERIEDGFVVGKLDNDPFDMPSMKAGDPVRLPLTHVIAVTFKAGKAWPDTPYRRTYWERCLVDACVVEGRSYADYIYREVPEMAEDGDKYPDSGWRIRGSEEMIEEDKRLDKGPLYIAVGKVLNADDRWLHLIDEGVGTAFQWDAARSDYVKLE